MAKKVRDNTINIKQSVLKGHIGASKLVNDDWKTIAYSFPRTHIKTRFEDKELRYNGIYFLFGYEDGKEVVYVGQALKRSNGESILARLRDHDDSYTESYCDKWNWVIAITNDGDTWGPTELNALESIMISETPYKNSLNGRKQNSGGADLNAYMDKVTQIKAFITAVGFNVFNDITETENINIIDKTYESNVVEDLQNGMSRIPEIVTPHKVVKAMVDMLPADIWNPNTKFLDMACKGGEYLREVYDRLMETELLQSAFPNMIERSNHILNNQIYGIALSNISRDRAKKKLLNWDTNIKIIPNYINKLKGTEINYRPDGTRISIRDIFNDLFGGNMKFDVIIGNPPYNESDGGGDENRQSSKPLHSEFVNVALNDLKPKYLSFVMPCRWYVENDKYNKRIREQLFNGGLKEIHDYEKCSDIFNGVNIAGGVCYYIHDRDYHGETKIIFHNEGNTQINKLLDNAKPFYRSKIMMAVIEKVRKSTKIFMSDYVLTTGPFGFKRADKGSIIPDEYRDIKLIGANEEESFVSMDEITKNADKVHLFKVCTGYMKGSDAQVINPAWILYPNEVCTLTYMVVAYFNYFESANNCVKYLRTKFVRALLKITLTKQSFTADNYIVVPMQDFTSNSDIDWSQSITNIDQQLYRKYNLSSDEVAYIEAKIKSMESYTIQDIAAAYVNKQLNNQP